MVRIGKMITLFISFLIFSASVRAFETQSETVNEFYAAYPNQLVWFENEKLTMEGMVLSQLLADFGLESYHRQTSNSLSFRDKNYTQGLFVLLEKISISQSKDMISLYHSFSNAVTSNNLSSFLESIIPPYNEFHQLRVMIRVYKSNSLVPWPKSKSQTFKLGQRSEDITQLRRVLIALGDLPAKKVSDYRASIYDPDIKIGLKSFQKRHGISQSGALDEKTALALNISPNQRIEQMQINLWRWLRLPAELPDRYVWINIPSYRLNLLEFGDSVLQMKVIVGKPSTPTPILFTELTQMTINPSWTPPHSIVFNELLPLDSKSPGYLSSQDFELRKGRGTSTEVIDINKVESHRLATMLAEFRLVQAPGRKNALGKYRFSIPNNRAIFLHDTPAKKLFGRNERAISHGCVRLGAPERLAKYLMSADSRRLELERAVRSNETNYFNLVKPIPVFVTYYTSWVDGLGVLQVRDDIYGLDQDGSEHENRRL
ncbi:L,D-transpeptidase family protein [Shewanella atlantica]|uniref:Murein L,D-transpeptidase n=1 Tax=Shewanella atlantica TaxID=271099 RepID=A0A431WD97_9GAMM|nr:L,D-transpeptidase family protein [Shewanella atlantica]RTR33359.1 murein L,D-transpeptidase [Shewanella atlantica]